MADAGISLAVALPTLAWTVYQTCRDSSADFQGITADIASMQAVIQETEELDTRHFKPEQWARLETLKKTCYGALVETQKHVEGYDSLATQRQRTWDRFRFGLQDVTKLRSQLVSSTTSLGAFNSAVMQYVSPQP